MLKACPPLHTFDVTKSATLYSTLAGVLAGFAFTALIYLLAAMGGQTRADRADQTEIASQENHVIVSLFCALFALVITTFLYAILASEQNESLVQGRAASEEVLSGIAFAFSIAILFYALVLLIDGIGLKRTAREARAIIALTLPPLAMMFLGFTAQDMAFGELASTAQRVGRTMMCTTPPFYHQATFWAATVMPIVVLGVCGILWLVWSVRGTSENVLVRRQRRYIRNALPKLSLVIIVIAAVWSATWSERDPGARLSHSWVWVWLTVAAIGLVTVAAFLLWGSPGASVSRTEPEPVTR